MQSQWSSELKTYFFPITAVNSTLGESPISSSFLLPLLAQEVESVNADGSTTALTAIRHIGQNNTEAAHEFCSSKMYFSNTFSTI